MNRFLVIILVIASDLYSKFYVHKLFAGEHKDFIYVNKYFNITLLYNKGITFGLMDNLAYSGIIFSVIAILVAVMLIIWLSKTQEKWQSYSLMLISGGAIGNAIDRIINGAVTDFLDFHWQNHHWYNFNIADACISVGVTIMIISSFLQKNVGEDEQKKLS